jgi:ribosomal protein S18 acetylase RimI-like enzyme
MHAFKRPPDPDSRTTAMSINSNIMIRQMTIADLPVVCEIQKRCYDRCYWEKYDVLVKKIALFPSGCFIAFDKELCGGYIFSHPWFENHPVPLDSPIESLPATTKNYYLHDLSIDPKSRGNDIGRKLIDEVIKAARAIGAVSMQLVSVQKSQSYWKRFGFIILEDLYPKSNVHLTNYGSDAQMMSLYL